MREFVNSLKRLYENKKIEKCAIERQRQNERITEEEYRYILDTANDSSNEV